MTTALEPRPPRWKLALSWPSRCGSTVKRRSFEAPAVQADDSGKADSKAAAMSAIGRDMGFLLQVQQAREWRSPGQGR